VLHTNNTVAICNVANRNSAGRKSLLILSNIKYFLVFSNQNLSHKNILQAVTSCNTMVFNVIGFFSISIKSDAMNEPLVSSALNREKNGIPVANRNAKRFAIK